MSCSDGRRSRGLSRYMKRKPREKEKERERGREIESKGGRAKAAFVLKGFLDGWYGNFDAEIGSENCDLVFPPSRRAPGNFRRINLRRARNEQSNVTCNSVSSGKIFNVIRETLALLNILFGYRNIDIDECLSSDTGDFTLTIKSSEFLSQIQINLIFTTRHIHPPMTHASSVYPLIHLRKRVTGTKSNRRRMAGESEAGRSRN